MKKLFKSGLFLSFLAGLILFTVAFLFLGYESRYGRYTIYQVSGQSMVDYGLNDGDRVKLDSKECSHGDICVFELLPDTCNEMSCFKDGITHKVLIKFLKPTTDNCYFFIGNDDPDTSFDSRDFGCLNANQFKLIGVLHT